MSFECVLDFLGCIVDIMDAFDTIRELDPSDGIRLPFVAKRVSVALRKLMLDGNGNLLKTCLTESRIHPLQRPLPGAWQVEAVGKLKAVEVTAVFEEQGKHATFNAPEGELRTTIDPLYGVRYEGEGVFALESPFDLTVEPIKFKAWISGNVIQVDDMVFKASELLRLIANKEGAHIERGQKLILPDTNTKRLESRNARYESVNALKFAGLSYAQIFCMFTALYVVDRAKDVMDETRQQDSDMFSRICDRVEEYRTKLLIRGKFANEGERAFVIGSDFRPDLTAVGALYSTSVKIP